MKFLREYGRAWRRVRPHMAEEFAGLQVYSPILAPSSSCRDTARSTAHCSMLHTTDRQSGSHSDTCSQVFYFLLVLFEYMYCS